MHGGCKWKSTFINIKAGGVKRLINACLFISGSHPEECTFSGFCEICEGFAAETAVGQIDHMTGTEDHIGGLSYMFCHIRVTDQCRQGYIYTVKGKGSFVADNTVMKENRKKEVLLQVSDMIDEAIRVGIPGDEIKNMVEIQYKAAKRNGGGEA